MNKRKWAYILARLLTLFLVGYCVYIATEVIYKSISYPLTETIGGTSFLLFDQIGNMIFWNLDLILQGCIGSAIMTGSGLIVGEGLRILNQTSMQDCSDMSFNCGGIICLPFSIVWIFIMVLGILITDAYNYYLSHEEP